MVRSIAGLLGGGGLARALSAPSATPVAGRNEIGGLGIAL
jgi:hypothetical protein